MNSICAKRLRQIDLTAETSDVSTGQLAGYIAWNCFLVVRHGFTEKLLHLTHTTAMDKYKYRMGVWQDTQAYADCLPPPPPSKKFRYKQGSWRPPAAMKVEVQDIDWSLEKLCKTKASRLRSSTLLTRWWREVWWGQGQARKRKAYSDAATTAGTWIRRCTQVSLLWLLAWHFGMSCDSDHALMRLQSSPTNAYTPQTSLCSEHQRAATMTSWKNPSGSI